ncbi:MAG: hypothetical protein DRQ64_01640, partial [Gammaproteobacteria bacterium]
MQRSKIQLRIIVPVIVLLTASAVLLFSAIHNYIVAEKRLENTGIEQVRRSLSLLKQEIEYHALQANPINNAQRLLTFQGFDNSFKALAIINPSGQVLASRFADKKLTTT